MAKRPLPTPDELRQLLWYEPETGKLFWRERGAEWFAHCTPGHQDRIRKGWNAAWSGKEAGVTGPYGYNTVTVQALHLMAHRIIWCMEHGHWPNEQIDHIDGDRVNNRLENLRECTHTENQRNMRRSRSNTSGVTGVYWDKKISRWKAEVSLKSRKIYVGVFRDLKEAETAVKAKRAELGFSDRHGTVGLDFDAWRARSHIA